MLIVCTQHGSLFSSYISFSFNFLYNFSVMKVMKFKAYCTRDIGADKNVYRILQNGRFDDKRERILGMRGSRNTMIF